MNVNCLFYNKSLGAQQHQQPFASISSRTSHRIVCQQLCNSHIFHFISLLALALRRAGDGERIHSGGRWLAGWLVGWYSALCTPHFLCTNAHTEAARKKRFTNLICEMVSPVTMMTNRRWSESSRTERKKTNTQPNHKNDLNKCETSRRPPTRSRDGLRRHL